MHDFSLDRVQLSKRAKEWEQRQKAESQRRLEELRAERRAGLVPERVFSSLRSCTIPQLVKAKKLCDKFILDQRRAPPDRDCGRFFVIGVLLSIPHKNERFRYEITLDKKPEKTYVSGPYWYRYWRDGKIVFRKAVGTKKERELPRKVKSQLREFKTNHDVDRILEEAKAKHC